MRESWKAQRCPPDQRATAAEHVAKWKHHAAQMQSPQSSYEGDRLPSTGAFDQVIDKASGAAGCDGRGAKATKMFKKLYPELI